MALRRNAEELGDQSGASMGDQPEAGDVPMVPENMQEATDPMVDLSEVGDVLMVPEDMKEATDAMVDPSEVGDVPMVPPATP